MFETPFVSMCVEASSLNPNFTLQEKPLGKMMDEPQYCSSFDLFLEIQIGNARLSYFKPYNSLQKG